MTSSNGHHRNGTGDGGTPPNVVWIVSDQLRSDALGCYGAPIGGVTPNIDRLAQSSARFSAVCQAPLCVPSRASFFTGLRCRDLDIFQNDSRLNVGPHHRRRLAEDIARIGERRWQALVDEEAARLRREWNDGYTAGIPEERIPGGAVFAAEGRLLAESGIAAEEPRHPLLPEMFAAHGYHTAAFGKIHHNAPTTGFAECIESGTSIHPFGVLREYSPDNSEFVMLSLGWAEVIRGGVCTVPLELTPDAIATEQAVEFLRRATPPFLLHLSIIWPHSPTIVPPPYDTLVDPASIELPRATDEELRSKPNAEKAYRAMLETKPLTPDEVRTAIAHYHGLVTQVDALIGRLLDALAESQFADSTVVALHVDHGDLMGEHGLFEKCTFYDPVVRGPLLLRPAGGLPAPVVVDEPVELLDLAPTLLGMCGLDAETRLDGLDLTPAVHGGAAPHREATYSELQSFSGGTRRMVRHGEWRMEATVPPHPEDGYDAALYNLADDPGELHNRAGDPACREHAERLLAMLEEYVAAPAALPV